ncbi:putative serine/threonine-protein kinase [Triangularia verruculosa]|uniref:non-specific serine/threonine protein kinase n=1 Tax=Triangularia verruculosa TaxID=2587418 RepID=A0AAN6XRC5_9PEZI|nr:putative serine/threonine-protein kinase [Triangularia verruculosa]
MKSRTAEQHSQIASISLGAGYKLNDNTSVWSFAPSDHSPTQASKLSRHRFGILSAFKSLTNLTTEKPPVGKKSEERPSGCRGAKSILSAGILKMSSALLRAPMEPTIIHRTQTKSRPLLHQQTFEQHQLHIESFPLPPPQVITPAATNTTNSNDTVPSLPSTQQTSNNNSSASPKNSTGQTSMDSSPNKEHRKGADSTEKKQNRHQHNIPPPPSTVSTSSSNAIRHHAHYSHTHHHRDNHIDTSPATVSPSPDSILTTIQESPLDVISPSILTVEKAAAAKIALESYFNEKYASGPTDRESRKQILESQLSAKSSSTRKGWTAAQASAARAEFLQQETDNLREMRVLKSRGAGMNIKECRDGVQENGFEEVQILGKGSFGVVKLVRKSGQGKVYAMKCIRKRDMIKTQQEGHLKAERDFLIASEGCQWVVQLIASFQDLKNLYLVTEYMPGGDFLGFLIRQNTLPEEAAKFYIAEMILAVEATHSLKFIHRDIKPNNFLISASGHLKISDFSLAFDGHWSHDLAYFTSHRYSLVEKLGLHVHGDRQDKDESRSTQIMLKWTSNIQTGIEKHQPKQETGNGDGGGGREPLLNWRNRNGNRAAAVSIMGTSQYMAPEVVKGECYDARCDYWSVAVILYECLYGSTPFFSEEGRSVTKRNILNHRETFHLPQKPVVSSRCQHLLASLITEKENRLCSKKYRMKDFVMASRQGTGQQQQGMMTSSMSAPSLAALGVATMMPGGGNFDGNGGGGGGGCGGGPAQVPNPRWANEYADHFVFPNDAEDIKSHKWFKTIAWDHLHQTIPPHIPILDSADDTTYFDDESLSDWSKTSYEDPASENEEEIENQRLEDEGYHGMSKRALEQMAKDQKMMQERREEEDKTGMMNQLRRRPSLQKWVLEAMKNAPFDIEYYSGLELEIDNAGPEQGITHEEKSVMKMYLFQFGCRMYRDGEAKTKDKKEEKKKKRPRDKILRDPKMGRIAMDVRRRTAFAGYEWVGCRGLNTGDADVLGGQENSRLDGTPLRVQSTRQSLQLQQQAQIQTPRQAANVGMGLDGGYDGSPESISTPRYQWGPPPPTGLPPPHVHPAMTGFTIQPDPFWRPPAPPQPQFTHAQYQQSTRQFSPYQQQQPRQFRPQHHPPQQSRHHTPNQKQYQSQIPRHIPSPRGQAPAPR